MFATHLSMSDGKPRLLDLIAEFLPVEGVPELVAAHLISDPVMDSNTMETLLQFLTPYTSQDGSTFLQGNFGGEQVRVRHSFDDKPAINRHNGNLKQWYHHGKLHREHGPAINISNVYHGHVMATVLEHVEFKAWMTHGAVKKILLDGEDITARIPDLQKYVRMYEVI